MLNANGLRMLPELPPPPPKFSGNALIRSVSITVACSPDSVFSIGASVVTVTVSVTEPICSLTSIRAVCATCTSISECTAFLNPGASTVRTYRPEGREGIV